MWYVLAQPHTHTYLRTAIAILDILCPPSINEFNKVYLVQELMETDLHPIIPIQELPDDHCQCFIYQTLCMLNALHSANVLHRHFKPSNLLLNATLCYFGLAWYCVPKVMLTFEEYTCAIDMWSVGCVLAEMLSGKPLFPGRDCVSFTPSPSPLPLLASPPLFSRHALATPANNDPTRPPPALGYPRHPRHSLHQ
ncbi:kinase-like domain-containing protein [Mycena olivaceomarginata]|nr:kinase-like domain-containing protein [Mycena olivaceomarginata]